MAISLVEATSGESASGGNVTLTLPGGIAQNDVVIFALGNGDDVDTNLAMTTAGYTELADLYGIDTGSADTNLGVFRKRMGASPDATAVGTGVAAIISVALAYTLRGVDTTTSEDAATTSTTAANGAAPDSPSITTVTANAWVLSIGAQDEAQTGLTYVAPTDYSDTIQVIESSGLIGVAMARKLVASAGAENPAAWTGFGSAGNSAMAAATVALRPAVVTQVQPPRTHHQFQMRRAA